MGTARHDFDFFDERLCLRGHAQLYVLYSSCPSPRRLMESLWVALDRGLRDGTTSFSRNGVRLTSRLLYLELVGRVGSPRQQLDSSMEYHASAQSRTGWGFP